MRLIPYCTLVLFLLTGCGSPAERDAGAGKSSPPPPETAAAEDTGPAEGELHPDLQVLRDRYAMEYDPHAVYGLVDVPTEGNFVKLNFSGLTDQQINRVMHRLKTERSICDGCENLYLEEALAFAPADVQALQQAKEIIEAERGR